MKRNDDSVNEKIKEFVDRNFIGLFLITGATVVLLYAFRGDDLMIFAAVVLFFLAVFFVIRIINKQLIFNENDISVRTKILGIKLRDKTYLYDKIYKFIIGRHYGIDIRKKYAVYIDWDDTIVKVLLEKDYKGCLDLMEKIKTRAGKLTYDATDEGFVSEDDLFRSYYKMKRMVDEIKNEKKEI
ncbi:MAG: hypothetical protein LBI91_04055 [Spirochaetaceae bacterium]|nr:hypothetical protein [Spirochaetaceae bacterium]